MKQERIELSANDIKSLVEKHDIGDGACCIIDSDRYIVQDELLKANNGVLYIKFNKEGEQYVTTLNIVIIPLCSNKGIVFVEKNGDSVFARLDNEPDTPNLNDEYKQLTSIVRKTKWNADLIETNINIEIRNKETQISVLRAEIETLNKYKDELQSLMTDIRTTDLP